MKTIQATAIAIAAILSAPALGDDSCTAASGAQRVALLELYTSEGCDSCPPTDRWVSGLPDRGFGPDRVVALGFHVDYWNYLGWTDPFARSEYSARQRAASHRNRARFVYTPQLLLNGQDFRRGMLGDGLSGKLRELESVAPRASIRLMLRSPSTQVLEVSGSASVSDPAAARESRLYYALYENRLATEVRSGENRGKRLLHDFVVRRFAGPFPVDAPGHRFTIDSGWKPDDLRLAAFVQDERTGDVLQALAAPYCR